MRLAILVGLILATYSLILPARGDTPPPAPDIGIQTSSAASNLDGRFEVFALGADKNLYHRWQLSDPTQWSDWAENIAGQYSELTTIRTAGGQLFLFGLDAGTLVIRAQQGPGGGWAATSVRTGHALQHIAIAQNSDGRIQVVAIDGGGHIVTLNATTASPDLQPTAWTDWTTIGGIGINELALAKDGDGRLTVAGLSSDALFLAQERLASPDRGWQVWPAKPQPALPKVGIHGIRLAGGKDGKLWLLAIGDHGSLYGQSLRRVGTSPPFRPLSSVVPARPTAVNPVITTLVPSLDRPLPLGTWSAMSEILAEGFVYLNQISVAEDRNGLIEIAGLAENSFAVHLTQNADGSWPTIWTLIPSDARIIQYMTISMATNNSGQTELFATDYSSGKIFAIGKNSTETWATKTWTSLGKIPGAAEPDLVFASLGCLELFAGNSASTIRQSLATAVPARIAEAVAGTSLAPLVGNANAASRCSNNHEIFAVWLNHEVWPGVYQEAPVIPPSATFSYRIPAATLHSVIGGQIKIALDQIPDLDVTNYSVHLKNPALLEIDFDANYHKIAFSGKATALFSAASGKINCNADLSAGSPKTFYAVLTAFLPFVSIGVIDLTQFIEQEEAERAASEVQVLCTLSKAILSDVFIPRNSNTDPQQIFSLPYSEVSIDEASGLVASGVEFPKIRLSNPSVGIGQLLPTINTNDYAGGSSIDVFFIPIMVTDMTSDLRYSWSPSNSSSLLLPGFPGWPMGALYVFAIQPDTNPKTYDLGTMTLTVTDSLNQTATVTVPVRATTRKPP